MEDEVRRQERIKENKGRTECEKESGVSERAGGQGRDRVEERQQETE